MAKGTRRRLLIAWTACAAMLAVSACQPSAGAPPAPAAKPPAAAADSAGTGGSPRSGSAPASSAPAATQPAPLRPLKIQVSSKSAAFAFLYVTKGLGLFEQHGLDAEILTMVGSTGVAAVQANELAFMAATGSATRAALRGLPIRVVYVEATGADQVLIGAKGLTSVEQLRGKVVSSTGPAGNVTAFVVELLRLHGLTPGDYELLSAGEGRARAASLMGGMSAATMLDLSEALPLMREGYPLLDRVAGKIGLIFSGLATSTDALQHNRDLLRDGLRAVVAGSQALHTQRERVLPILAQEYALSLEDAAEIYAGLQPGWTADGRPTAAAVEFEFAMDQAEMGLTEPIRPEQVFDFSLLDEVQGRR